MDGAEVLAFSQMMRRWFIKRGVPARLGDEVESTAMMALLEQYQRKRIPLKGNRGYYFTAAKRQIAEAVKQSIGPVRIGGRAARLGIFELPVAMTIDPALNGSKVLRWTAGDVDQTNRAEVLASRAAPPLTPEEVLDQRARERARERLIKRILGHAQGMPAPARRNVAHLLQAIAPGVRVPRRRPSRNAAWNTVTRLRNLVLRNPGARRDRCVMIGQEERAA